MLSPSLRTQVVHLVDTMGVVEERQLHKFFDDWGKDAVTHCIYGLMHDGVLARIDDKHISFRSYRDNLPKPLSFYSPGMDAIEVMATFRSDQVLALYRPGFPVELVFTTIDGSAYDVTVFNGDDWAVKYSAVVAQRNKYAVPGTSDPIDHIAVVPSEAIAQKVESLFSLFAIVNRATGQVEFFSFEEQE